VVPVEAEHRPAYRIARRAPCARTQDLIKIVNLVIESSGYLVIDWPIEQSHDEITR